MAFIETVGDDEATADVSELYEADRARLGYVPNYTRVFASFSKTLDALGALPDPAYHGVEPDLREALVVGRPIAEG